MTPHPSGHPVTVTRTLPIPVRAAWVLVADPRNHARWIPLTRIDVQGWPLAVGTLFTATSGPLARRGAPGLPDRMRIDRYDPPTAVVPGVATFTKLGPLLLGTAEVRVAPLNDTTSRITWLEDVHLAGPLPRWLTRRLLGPALGGMLRLALRRAAREVDRTR